MRPLALLAIGVIVVGFDVSINGFDVLVDAAGWLICLIAVFSLRSASAWFQIAMIASAAGILLSLRGSIRPPEAGLLGALEGGLQTALVFSVCSGIIDRLRSVPGPETATDSSVSRQANLLRWLDLALTIITAGLVISLQPEPDLDGALPILLVLLVAGLAMLAWFVILLFTSRRHPSFQLAGVIG